MVGVRGGGIGEGEVTVLEINIVVRLNSAQTLVSVARRSDQNLNSPPLLSSCSDYLQHPMLS